MRLLNILTALASTITAIILLTACDTRKQDKTYVHAMDQAATTTDPVKAATIYDSFIVKNVYDTLYRYQYLARPYALTPNLAADLPEVSEDRLTYTIRIKPDVRFIDNPAFAGGKGRALVAQDVVYSLKRHFDPASQSQGAWLWRDRIVGLDDWARDGADYGQTVAGLRAIDDQTLQIRLVRPFPQLIYTLATAFSAIVPHEAVEAYGPEFGRKPVGSGPFMLERFDASRAVMTANPGFRSEPVDLLAEGYSSDLHAGLGLERIDGRSPPFVDRLELHFIQETSSRWAAMQSGRDVHFGLVPNEAVPAALATPDDTRPRPELAPRLADRFHARTTVESAVLFQAFNFDHPDFGGSDNPQKAAANRALRCAIVSAFDWPEHNRRIYNGLAQVYPGVIPPMVPEHDPTMHRESIERDIAKSKALLQAHGWSSENLPELTFGVPAGTTQRQIYEQFRAFMTEVGYPAQKIVLRQYASFGALNQAWKNSELPLINKGWGLDYPDAENVLQLFYGPNRVPGSNDGNFANPEYDQLFEQALAMLPGPERTDIYGRLNEIIVDECAAIAGLSRTRLMMWDKRAIAFPDRMMSGGYYLRFVDMLDTRPASSVP